MITFHFPYDIGHFRTILGISHTAIVTKLGEIT